MLRLVIMIAGGLLALLAWFTLARALRDSSLAELSAEADELAATEGVPTDTDPEASP